MCNTCDIGHPAVKDNEVFLILKKCKKVNNQRIERHTFLFLTKYPANILCVFKSPFFRMPTSVKWRSDDNIYIGTTITGLKPDLDKARLEALKLFKEAGFKTWVSAEPLLGAVPYLRDYLLYIDQVIVGGESGKDARPMHPDWARSIRDDCEAVSVPFYFKSWGEWKQIVHNDGNMLSAEANEPDKYWRYDTGLWTQELNI